MSLRDRALQLLPVLLVLTASPLVARSADVQPDIRVLMLGDHGHHRPDALAKILTPALAPAHIAITYSDDVAALSAPNLAKYDCLLLYLNTSELPAVNETALMGFVEQGKGLVALHCASFAFLNSPKYLHLVGGRFKSHEIGVFRTRIIDAQHPAMHGVSSFECWDETYVHGDLAEDIRVLMVRPHHGVYEPWTWVRSQGKGRVFYTASGHDERCWNNAGFQKLVESGTRWAAGRANDESPSIASLNIELPPSIKQGGAKLAIPAPLSPEESMRHMHLPEGFHVELVAAEPDVVKPVSMAFDERGRLWVVETQDYPETILPVGTPGHDRIVIAEDTRGTGRMDKFTVFADGLNLPQGICFANGGVVIPMSPDILYLKDSKRDGHADVRRVLYSGFGRGDTHAMHGNFQYGLDNWIWATCGYSGLNVKVGESTYHSGQCIFRFRADRDGFEVLLPTSNNTWGLGFNESGESFVSTANNSHSVFMAIPNRYFESVRGWTGVGSGEIEDHKKAHAIGDVRQWDVLGGYTAACGNTVYTARAFPPEYWDKVAFVCEPTEHIIHADLLSPAGSGYVAHDGYNILASDDSYVAPIQSIVGPDGSLYFIDWYTYIVQHNPTPAGFHTGPGGAYVTPLRDKKRGRIYRIVYDGGAKTPAPIRSVDRTSAKDLLAALRSDNSFWRSTAQRLLVERQDKDVVPDLVKIASDTSVDATGNNPAVIHALWTLHGLNALDSSNSQALAAAVTCLSHPAAGVRATALQVSPHTPESLTAILAAHALSDGDLHTRRVAYLAIADMPPSPAAGEAIWAALKDEENVRDLWLRSAATAAAARNDLAFLSTAARRDASAAPNTPERPPENLIANGNFAEMSGAAPTGWHTTAYSGEAEFSLDTGRVGRAVRITSKTGADAGWMSAFKIEPHALYRLSGWIRTADVDAGSSQGALFNVHEMQSPRVVTSPLTGTHDWTRVETTFDSGDHQQISVNCLFGGWGHARGTAWYEDVRVERVGHNEPAGMPIARTVAGHYARGGPVDSVAGLLADLKTARPQVAAAIMDGLATGWPADRNPKGENLGSLLSDCIAVLPPDRQEAAVQLASRWGIQSDAIAKASVAAAAQVLKQVGDSAGTDEQRVASAEKLIAIADTPGSLSEIVKQIKPQGTQVLSVGLIHALAHSRQNGVPKALVDRWRFLAPSARSAAIETFINRPAWTSAMLDAIEKDVIARADLSNAQITALTGNSDRALADRATAILAKRGALPNADRQKAVDAFSAATTHKGDVARGVAVFQKNCAVCHTFNGAGGQVGPDLSGVMNGVKTEILIAILDPSRSVEGNYRLWVVQTKKGDTYAGRLVSETKNAFEMLDTTGKPHTILREDVEKMAMQNKSIMPDGFESLGADQLTDLLEFVAQPKGTLRAPSEK